MNALDLAIAAGDDLEALNDAVLDQEGVVHLSIVGDEGHVLGGFPFVVCPCKPEIKIEEYVTRIIHRRTQ